jgi:hypothetical protein
MIARAALADVLILVRRGEDRLQPGDPVEFLRLT